MFPGCAAVCLKKWNAQSSFLAVARANSSTVVSIGLLFKLGAGGVADTGDAATAVDTGNSPIDGSTGYSSNVDVS